MMNLVLFCERTDVFTILNSVNSPGADAICDVFQIALIIN